MSAEVSISVKNLKKSYGDNLVLDGISFEVKKGTMLALLGPNGAGKTTTVKILSTLVSSDGGSVTVNGNDVVRDADSVREQIGLTGQSASIDGLLTGRENLIMMGRLYRLTKDSASQRAKELLDEFDLEEAADRPAKTYSGGMRRRLDLAVSLIAAPPILFLDEPTTGLDPRSRLVMWDIINNLKKSGATILLTTQYLEEADQLADNIILIDQGKVAAEGTAKDLKKKIGKDLFVLTFKSIDDAQKATKVLGKNAVHDTPNMAVSVGIKNDGSDIQKVLDAIKKANLSILATDIHKPTLDDVFLSITKGDN
ncbi:TPA: ATP-binding cassette domain-containing protein [Candidatus Saccharibacteria bacterium]|nr:ATP-binding cassette domain-containing protein [Candidatus Saccharibacteria bacterium]HIO87327.1 ATP-binding cassette domain-containing protein [Candidatus Saccharibacteria bacterium]